MDDILTNVHQQLKKVINPDSICIDATMGNGHDTVFLAQHAKRVYAFDIQSKALQQTKQRLKEKSLDNVHYIHDSHEAMSTYVAGNVDAVVFNFGYLPGSDKSVTTQCESSLLALKEALALLKPKGIIALTFYPGHQEGKEEVALIEPYVESLDTHIYRVLKYQFINKINSPFTIFIEKIRSEENA